jgi:CubicO group peptidase (beta-lactamase class C family)
MRRLIRRFRVLVAVVGATALAGLPPAATAPSAASSPIERAEVTLAEQLEGAGIPGGVVAVVSGDGFEARGVGSAGRGREVTPTTAFVIGSASKSFTALAVMQLVDSGDVDLDAPVRDYVPELTLAPGEAADAITVRHLLQQTSGLDDLAGGPLLASASDGTPEEAVAEIAEATLASVPGERWRYANVNFVLAGLVVERASGLAYADYLEQHIFAPLSMTGSNAAVGSADTAEPSSGHRYWFGVTVAQDSVRRHATMAAGYLVSTGEDLGRYLAMYLAEGLAADGTRIVSEESLGQMLEPAPEAHLGPWADGRSSSYAMGWFRGGPWGDDVAFHPGNPPDTSTMLVISPSDDAAVAVVVNASHETPVPGNPSVTDRVTRNVAHAALGQPVAGRPSAQRFYLVFDLVVLALLGSALWGLVRAGRAAASPAPSAHRARRWTGVVVRLGLAALLAVALVLFYGWGTAWTWAPDLALVVTVLAVVLLLTAVLRLVALLRDRRAGPPAEGASGQRGERVTPAEAVPA